MCVRIQIITVHYYYRPCPRPFRDHGQNCPPNDGRMRTAMQTGVETSVREFGAERVAPRTTLAGVEGRQLWCGWSHPLVGGHE
jgi:hypothetical protein